MWPYASEDDALRDALRLSRAMSYKLALCDMPAGGAKSVIIGDSRKNKSEALFRAMGRNVERLGGKYIIAEDVGTTEEDMRHVAKETKFVVGKHTDTGPATAYGAFLGLKTAVQRGLGKKDLAGLRVAVQGLGGVGGRLCKFLTEAGAKLVVTDINEEAMARATALGARAVAPDAIYDQDVDVFSPNALGGTLNDETIPRLRCKVIAGAANNQLASERHADMIAARGILYAPDFVLNAGGVIGASQEGRTLGGDDTATDDSVYSEDVAFKDVEKIGTILAAVLDLADRQKLSPHVAAVQMAKDKIKERRAG